MEAFVRDLRFAQRMLISRPGFTVLAVVCLALGIGASAAIFSVVNGVLLKPLIFPEAERLVSFGSARGVAKDGALSAPDFVDMRAASTRMELAVYADESFSLRSNEAAVQLRGARISSNLFHVLGVAPLLGRAFTMAEELPKRGQEVILSDAAWKRQFSGDPKVVGKSVRIDATDYTAVGVMPKGFTFPIRALDMDAWVPLRLAGDSTFAHERGAHYLSGIGRLAPGATDAQALAKLQSIVARLTALYPGSDADRRAGIVDLQDTIVKGSRGSLLLLAGAVGCLLLIACANVANLMLARSTLRAKEVAIRTAVGASRSVILRQVLTESVLLAIVGGGSVSFWRCGAPISSSPSLHVRSRACMTSRSIGAWSRSPPSSRSELDFFSEWRQHCSSAPRTSMGRSRMLADRSLAPRVRIARDRCS